MNVYVPILVLGAIAAAFAVFSVGVAVLAGPRRYNRAKLEAYECGIEPTAELVSGPHAAQGQRFPIKYYLTAMLFIIFDIEIVFLSRGRCRSTCWGCSVWSRWGCSWQRCSSPMDTCGGAAA